MKHRYAMEELLGETPEDWTKTGPHEYRSRRSPEMTISYPGRGGIWRPTIGWVAKRDNPQTGGTVRILGATRARQDLAPWSSSYEAMAAVDAHLDAELP